jgi:hypothetical protein
LKPGEPFQYNRATIDEFFETPENGRAGDINVLVYYRTHTTHCFVEADVVVNFTEHVLMPLKDAFHDFPYVFFAKEHQSTGDGEGATAKAADCLVKLSATQTANSVCVSELKTPGVIDAAVLPSGFNGGVNSKTRKLLQELKG